MVPLLLLDAYSPGGSSNGPRILFTLFLSAWLLCSRVLVRAEDDYELANEIPRLSGGSCLAAGICCPGRDSSCVIQKAAPNAIIEDLDDVPCYCDHACLTLGDCCTDFKSACGVQDCQVSDWGRWSECDTECGLGVMNRTRQIIVEPRNGGKPCPAMLQKRGCRGSRCHQYPNRATVEDTAIILPIEFSAKRRRNATGDITRNLRLRYPKNPARDKSKPYCVEFEVMRTTRACKQLESFMGLSEGYRVCVICEREAQRSHLDYKCAGGQSENGRPTRFSSLREPACHGKWKLIHSDLTCGCDAGAQYIFI